MFKKQTVKNSEKVNPYFLAIDIGTEYIKSSVFKEVEGQVEIVGYSKVKQTESSMYAAFIINLQSVIDACDKSVGMAVKNAMNMEGDSFSIPTDAVIGIAGELVHGVSIMVNVDRENPNSTIDQKEIDRFIQKVKKFTFSSTLEEISQEIGIKSSKIQEVSTVINSVLVDGHKVLNPIGYKGSELIYKVFSTFAPKIHLDSINQVSKSLGLKNVNIVVEPYALAVGLKSIRDPNSSAIIIDVGGGTTDVALVINGDIVGTRMFAIGGQVFTKRIAKELTMSFSEAEDLKIEYSNGTVNTEYQLKLSKVLSSDVSTWLTGVEIALETFLDNDVREFPPQIYLCGGGALLPEIQEGLLTHPWLQTLKFKKFPKISFVFPNSLVNVLDKTKSANLPSDVTPLALARVHLDKF
jgi:cell division protein FtsA